ncbi:hypothetical protein [Vogesella sp. AC12]|uniref:hypothetical protein n=1 Tax=Vogesella sp. AC12 TaxID=2950550 RepID=UPI00210E2E91|nr:hypothetical protein [Vogesella sp. AC12]MCQ4143240.1 hypothetical protein [Vogesella sp. AC12]
MNVSSDSRMNFELDMLATIQRFKKDLVKLIPYVPKNKEAKDFLLSLGVDMLIHMHDFWRHRLIEIRPREVEIASWIRNSTAYINNKEKINKLMTIVRGGGDINCYLSEKVHSRALDVEAFKADRDFMRSRDRMLVCEGFHHLHLEPYPGRTNYLIIAKVFRSRMDVIGVFPHAIFDDDCLSSVRASYESALEKYSRMLAPAGGFFIGGPGGGMQNLAGSSVESTFFHTGTYKIIKLIEEYNGGLEEYTRGLYAQRGRSPRKINPVWVLDGRSLEIHDKVNKTIFKGDDIRVNVRGGCLTPIRES